ncbi:MAG TPA: patatin-like phospholipase family protein [Micromonosporaceae bacterium]|jgi:NTE family protein
MTTALVLGSGGLTGAAWELGILAGLADEGVDVTDADTVIGTSAGSVVGAQLAAGVPIDELYQAQLVRATAEIPAKLGARFNLMTAAAMLRSPSPQRFRQRIGARALATRTVSEATRHEVIVKRLPSQSWPDRRLLIVAVDALSGEVAVFGRDAGVSLADAVAASCAVPTIWPPARIGDRRFIDGGLRSWANADLAEGADRIVVLAPMPQGSGPMTKVADQVSALARAATVALIVPDRDARVAMGGNILDPSRRSASAWAGRRQGAQAAAIVRSAWLGAVA